VTPSPLLFRLVGLKRSCDDKRGAEKTAGLAAEDPSARAEGKRQVAETCRYYGISRKTFYKWRKLYEAEGPDWLV